MCHPVWLIRHAFVKTLNLQYAAGKIILDFSAAPSTGSSSVRAERGSAAGGAADGRVLVDLRFQRRQVVMVVCLLTSGALPSGLEFVQGSVVGSLPNTMARMLGHDIAEASIGRGVVIADPSKDRLDPAATVE